MLIFRRIQLYTCSIWYCHSLWEFLVACRYTAWVRTDCRGKVVGRASYALPTTFPLQSVLTLAAYRQATRNSHREWRYHMLHVYNYVLLKMSTWCSKHVEENSILWINNNQCINLVINTFTITLRHSKLGANPVDEWSALRLERPLMCPNYNRQIPQFYVLPWGIAFV